MILELLLMGVALATDDEDADERARHRAPLALLVDRAIGTTSVPVAFNWRNAPVQLGFRGSVPLELNNFNSLRGGATVRWPAGSALVEITASYAHTWDTPSSRLLAFTPYRQPGRPSRADLDVLVGLPLAEGVVTAKPRWLPALQLVVSAQVGLRYHVYPSGFAGLRTGQVLGAVVNPTLTEPELENLEAIRLNAMQVDTGRYGFVTGIGQEIYLKQGWFISPRALIAVPILAPASGTQLRFAGDLSIAIGLAL